MPKWAIIVLAIVPGLVIAIGAYIVTLPEAPVPPAIVASYPPIDLPVPPVIVSPAKPIVVKTETMGGTTAISHATNSTSYAVTGNAWLTKNDGSSNILRGLHVHILPAKLPQTLMNQFLVEDEKEWSALKAACITNAQAKYISGRNDPNVPVSDILQHRFIDTRVSDALAKNRSIKLSGLEDTHEA